MSNMQEVLELLNKSSYLDEIISYYRDCRDPLILQLLLDDPDYSDVLRRKFFYPNRESMLRDVEDFESLDRHISDVTDNLQYWFNCIRHSQTHTVDKVRFLQVYDGKCAVHCEHSLFHLYVGDTCVVPAGMPFSHEGLGDDCRLIHALIAPDYLQRILMNKLPHTGIVPTSFFQRILDPQEKCIQIIQKSHSDNARSFLLSALYENHYKKMYYREPLESYLVLFITELLRELAVSAEQGRYTRSAEDKRILDIKRYIAANSKTVTLAGTAAHFHFTSSYLSQFISKRTGQTFTQLVQEARLNEASRLLLYTAMSVSEVIATCGYQNMSYFYRIFAHRFGCTPSEYRQKNYGLEEGKVITDNTLPQ